MASASAEAASPGPGMSLRHVLWLLSGLTLLFVVLWQAPAFYSVQTLASYLPLHMAAETFSIVVSMLVFGIAWNAYSRERAGNIVILGCALCAVGLIDFAHVLSYKGMPEFVTPSGVEKAIDFWLAARALTALTLLVVAFRAWRPLADPRSRYVLLAGMLIVAFAVIWLGLYHPGLWPRTFVRGRGLTPFKIEMEDVIMAVLLLPAVRFYLLARRPQPFDAASLFAATFLTILSELSFTLYSNVADIFNLLGHLYKVLAYAFIYRAVFVASVREPFQRLDAELTEKRRIARELQVSQSLLDSIVEHMPAMVFLKTAGELRFELFNRAGEQLLGYDRHELLGKSDADLFPAAQAQGFMHDDRAVLAGHQVLDVPEESVKAADGSQKWLRTLKTGLYDEQGKPTHLLGISLDITDKKRAELALGHANRALKTLSTVNRELVHAVDEVMLMQSICTVAVEQNGYRMAWVGYARDNAGKDVEVVAMAGVPQGLMAVLRPGWGEDARASGPTGRAIRTGKTQRSRDLADEPDHGWKDALRQSGCVSSLALPLRLRSGEVFGALHVYSGERDAFTDNEVALLEEMAGDLAFGVDVLRVRLERDEAMRLSEEHLAQLHLSLDETIAAIAKTVEARDPYTAGHQRRVAELAVAIGRHMGLDEETLQGIHMGATIHDIGKLQVPAEILTKPAKLDAIEYALVKQHPQVGYEILKEIHFPWPVAEIAYQHHERLDGSGYPQGLKGDEICLEARIVAVADVVEAMSSHRPYRAGLGLEVALAEIGEHKGTHYDAEAVDACQAVFAAGFHFSGVVGVDAAQAMRKPAVHPAMSARQGV